MKPAFMWLWLMPLLLECWKFRDLNLQELELAILSLRGPFATVSNASTMFHMPQASYVSFNQF